MDTNSGSANHVVGRIARQGRRRLIVLLAVVSVLLLSFGLMLSSATRKSATVDEQSHLFRGVAYLREGATHFLLGHPLLGGALSALPLLSEQSLELPVNTPAWEAGDWSVAGDQFLWQLNESPLRLILLGRLPVIWMTLLLGALVFRWVREWAGARAGLAGAILALAMILLDPNVLAHGRLITGDLPLVLFFTLSLYGYWHWSRHARRDSSPGFGILGKRAAFYLLLAGLGLGLAAATKFNAALLVPILLLWALMLAWRRQSTAPLLALVVTGLVGWFTVWLVYGFSLWHGVIPGGAFWDDVAWQLTYVGELHGVYLLGRISATSWLAYFPIALGVKTPLLTLVLLAAAIFSVLKRRSGQAVLFLLVPALLYFAGSMIVALNIGYRYLLPILPLLIMLVALSLFRARPLKRTSEWLIAGLVCVYAVLAWWVWPDYVPYFNILTGTDSWRILSDSNVDWGQDLMALGHWQRESEAQIKLSYFGTAHPSAYGVSFEPLPTWAPAPEQGDPTKQAFYPADPAPGTYAISVTNLHGVVLGEAKDSYAWFRDREPWDRIGGSIFIYDVESRGEPASVALSGLTPAEMAPTIHDRFATNDVHIRWINAQDSRIFPAEGGWLVISGKEAMARTPLDALPIPALEATIDGQMLYRLPPAPELTWADGEVDFADTLTFLGYEDLLWDEHLITLLTAWRVERATQRPLKLFVHALDENGAIISQWDGLDIDPGSWQEGDVFVQRHTFALPDALQPSSIAVGVYDSSNAERLGRAVYIELDD